MNADSVVDVAEMVAAYKECAIWTSTIDGYWDDDLGEFVSECADFSERAETGPMDEYFDVEDIAPETADEMERECVEFIAANHADLAEMEPGQAGHDFWLTRNGHGAGFWDRGLGALGDRLSDAASVYGEYNLYIGDDGKVWGQ